MGARDPLDESHKWKRVTRELRVRNGEVGREYERAMAQLRTGHCMWLNAHKARCGKLAQATCTRCGKGEEGTEHYLLQCRAYKRAREETIGQGADVTVLAKEPEKVAEYIRRTGRLKEHIEARRVRARAGPGRKGGRRESREGDTGMTAGEKGQTRAGGEVQNRPRELAAENHPREAPLLVPLVWADGSGYDRGGSRRGKPDVVAHLGYFPVPIPTAALHHLPWRLGWAAKHMV